MHSDGRLHEDETIVCDIVVLPIEEEVSISNQLAGRLDIQILDMAKSVWRLNTDPPGVAREGVGRQMWR